MKINAKTILHNAALEGTTDKKRTAFILSLGWDNIMQLLQNTQTLNNLDLLMDELNKDL